MVRRRRKGRAPPAIPPKTLLKASTPTPPFLVSQKLFLLLRQIWKIDFHYCHSLWLPWWSHISIWNNCDCKFTGSSAARLSHESQVAVGGGRYSRGRRSTWEELKQPERLKSREREEVMNPLHRAVPLWSSSSPAITQRLVPGQFNRSEVATKGWGRKLLAKACWAPGGRQAGDN